MVKVTSKLRDIFSLTITMARGLCLLLHILFLLLYFNLKIKASIVSESRKLKRELKRSAIPKQMREEILKEYKKELANSYSLFKLRNLVRILKKAKG